MSSPSLLYPPLKKKYYDTKRNTEEILEGHEESRSSDVLIYFLYLAKHDHPIFKQVVSLLGVSGLIKLTNPETITRVRQIIQNKEKRYRPTPDEARIRAIKTIEVKKWINDQQIEQYLHDEWFPEIRIKSHKEIWIPEL